MPYPIEMKTHDIDQLALPMQEPMLTELPYTPVERARLIELKFEEAKLVEFQRRLMGANPHAYTTEELEQITGINRRRIGEFQERVLVKLRRELPNWNPEYDEV